MNSKYLLDKIKKGNYNYSNEFNNLRARDNDYNYRKNSKQIPRHNSNFDALSWRKGSNTENSKDFNSKKGGNFIGDK